MSGEKAPRKQSFLQGVAVLTAATIIVKLLGFIYKVPLQNILQERGFGYFNTAYDVYNVLLMISTTGLPVAVSRMISQAQALENYAQIRKIYSVSMKVFLTIGVIGTLVMLVFCKPLSVMVTTNENSWAAIAALSPCVLLICLVSAYRGFFQGQSNMTPTSVSQIFEAVTRLVVGLGLAWLVMKLTGEAYVRAQGIALAPGESARDYGDITLAAGGAILGVTLGSLISAVYLHCKFRQSSAILSMGGGQAKSTKGTMKELLSIAVPITLGSAGLQIINLFDTMIYMRRLTGALQWTEKMADSAKGVYNFCQTVFALPCSFIPTITIAVIPAITASLTKKDLREAKSTSESAVRTMALIAMPCAFGLALLAEPITALLGGYSGGNLAMATRLMTVLGFTILFNALVLVSTAIMQAHGHAGRPVINMLIGGVVNLVAVYVLAGMPLINILGTPTGLLMGYVVISILNILSMRRLLPKPPAILPNLLRSFFAAAVMGILAWGALWALKAVGVREIGTGRLILCAVPVLVGVVSYFFTAVKFKVITHEDCLLLPKGEKIAKILKL